MKLNNLTFYPNLKPAKKKEVKEILLKAKGKRQRQRELLKIAFIKPVDMAITRIDSFFGGHIPLEVVMKEEENLTKYIKEALIKGEKDE